jgi:uncharacterized protein DUF2800
MTQAPSKAPLWSACALAGSLLAGHGETSPHAEKGESDSRREGKTATWLAARLLRGHIATTDAVGQTAPNGWVITDDMMTNAMAFCDYVRGHGGALYHATTPVVLGGGAIQGHVDDTIAVVAGHMGDTLHVFDLRYGWRIVEPERDPTLMCYGLGLANAATARIHLHVYQPRPYHPDGPARVWTMPASEMTQWHDWLVHMATMGNNGNQAAMPGSQCERHACAGRSTCAALKANVYANHDRIAGRGIDRKMTATELAAELDFLERAEDMLKARKAGIEAEAEGRIRGNEHVAGWEVGLRKGHAKFTVPAEKVLEVTGVNPYEQKLVTPAELKRRGAKKELVETITHSPTIGYKLQRVDAKAYERMFKR